IVNNGKRTATGIMQNNPIIEYKNRKDNPLLKEISLNAVLISFHICEKPDAFSSGLGLGICIKKSEIIAKSAPSISNSKTFPMDNIPIAKAPKAGPAIPETD